MTRSSSLLERCAAALALAADHPLLRAMSDGTVPPAVFARYLVLEEGFVDTAARLVEVVAVAETDAAAARRLAETRADLEGAQRAHLAAARAGTASVLGAPPAAHDVLSRHTLALADAHGAPAVTVCLAAAETLYARWCAAAAARDAIRPAALQGWIDLHATARFAEQAAFWRSLVDRIPEDEVGDAELDAWFAGMLAAENAFHAAAEADDASGTDEEDAA
ncbi:transcriptional regulator [Microbacterium sp. 18062]|uniref:transcriptional regulator n=1 Tax=Microbacterium sp. 18062 TaxID=2681410 RepID=UPI001359D1B4|nr:transcriptional regulator [Microbacterium sp. 18062]